MNDERELERLSAYFDDEVADVERAAVEDLLKSSSAAGDVLNDYRELSRLIQELPRHEVDDEFSAMVLRAAAQGMLDGAAPQIRISRGSHRQRLRALVVLACTVASLVIILPWLNVGPSHNAAPQPAAKENHLRAAIATDSGIAKQRGAMPARNTGRLAVDNGFAKKGRLEKLDARTQRFDNLPKNNAKSRGDQPQRAGEQHVEETLIPPISLATISKRSTVNDRGSRLVFIDDLKQLTAADVGKVITAFERTGDGISVVKLTVIDCNAGLKDLQVLLTRNAIQRQPEQTEGTPPADDQPRMIAVFVQATRRQLSAAVDELRNGDAFRSLRVDRSIPLALLDLSPTQPQTTQPRFVENGSSGSTPSGSFNRIPKTKKSGVKTRRRAIGPPSLSADRKSPTESRGYEKRQRIDDKSASKSSATAELAELEEISRQLRLTLSPRILRSLSALPCERQMSVVKGTIHRTRGRADRRRSAGKTLNVLFVLENCPPTKTGERSNSRSPKPAPANPAKSPPRNGPA